MDICLRVLKESNKSRFDSYSVRNSVLLISHITFRDCHVHIFPTTFLEIAVCMYTRDLMVRGQQRQRKRDLKREFAFYQTLSQLFQITYFVKCRGTLMDLNPMSLIQVQKEKENFLVAYLLPP